MAVIERWCCWASTSVGASSAAWPPESTTWSIARSATTVLPEPTSPCSSRCIGWPWPSSAAISSPTLRWPSVSANGSRSSNRSRMPPGAPGRGLATVASIAARRRASTVCATNASSYLSRFSAETFWPQLSGRWIQRSAWSTSIRSSASRTCGGSTLRDVVDEVEGEPDGVLELPGVHAGHGGVERDQVGHLGEVAALPAVHPGGGVGQLPLVVEPLQPPAEHAHAAHRQLLVGAPLGGVLVLVEVRQQQAAVLGADPHLEAVRGAVGTPVLVGLLDRLRPPRRPGRGCRPR